MLGTPWIDSFCVLRVTEPTDWPGCRPELAFPDSDKLCASSEPAVALGRLLKALAPTIPRPPVHSATAAVAAARSELTSAGGNPYQSLLTDKQHIRVHGVPDNERSMPTLDTVWLAMPAALASEASLFFEATNRRLSKSLVEHPGKEGGPCHTQGF